MYSNWGLPVGGFLPCQSSFNLIRIVMSGRTNGHRSHISSREAKARGRSVIPPWSVRQETLNMINEGDYMAGNYVSFSAGDISDTGSTTLASGDPTTYHTWGSTWADSISTEVQSYDYLPASYFHPTERVQVIERVTEIIKEKEVTKVADLRTLFRVYVVDPRKNGKVLMDGKPIIAENENQAMLKAGVAQVAAEQNVDIEELDVYVDEVGTFIRPRKSTQKVRIVKEDD